MLNKNKRFGISAKQVWNSWGKKKSQGIIYSSLSTCKLPENRLSSYPNVTVIVKSYQMIFTNVSCLVISWWLSHCSYLTFEMQIWSPSEGMHRLQEHTTNLCCKWSDDTAPASTSQSASPNQHKLHQLWRQPSSPTLLLQSASLGFLPSCKVTCPIPPCLPKLRRTELSVWYEHGDLSGHRCQCRVFSSLGFPSSFSSLPLARKLLGAKVVSVAPSSFGSGM